MGKSGLVRAYSGMVQKGLAALSVVEKQIVTELKLTLGYADMPTVQRVIDSHGATISHKQFDERVTLMVTIAEENREFFAQALNAVLQIDISMSHE